MGLEHQSAYDGLLDESKRQSQTHDTTLAQKVAAYESARRAAVLLWKAKRDLVEATQARFNKTHPVTLAVAKLTHHDPTCVIRSIADAGACACALVCVCAEDSHRLDARLLNDFNTIDTDGDGHHSVSEIQASRPKMTPL